jgi:hypothetical protein
MTSRLTTPLSLAAAAAAAAAAAFGLAWSGDAAPDRPGDLFSSAQAVVGRPLTPMSYAGVARRTTRRTVAATAAYPMPMAPPPPPVVVSQPQTVVVTQPAAPQPSYPPECTKFISDSTGEVYYRCP